jgi:phenylalanine-4-hydroxylase
MRQAGDGLQEQSAARSRAGTRPPLSAVARRLDPTGRVRRAPRPCPPFEGRSVGRAGGEPAVPLEPVSFAPREATKLEAYREDRESSHIERLDFPHSGTQLTTPTTPTALRPIGTPGRPAGPLSPSICVIRQRPMIPTIDFQRAEQRHSFHSRESFIRDGLKRLQLDATDIPTEKHINQRLAPTGWSVVFVDGYLPAKVYVELILTRSFPVARDIRSLRHLDLSPVPDLVHDVLGHLPMLFSEQYRLYLLSVCSLMRRTIPESLDDDVYVINRQISKLKSMEEEDSERVSALERRLSEMRLVLETRPSKAVLLERIFLWSIEFGLFGTIQNHQIYGAGLLSSPREIEAVSKGTAPIHRYTHDVVRHDICFTGAQSQFFVASGYQELHDVLAQFVTEHGPLRAECA